MQQTLPPGLEAPAEALPQALPKHEETNDEDSRLLAALKIPKALEPAPKVFHKNNMLDQLNLEMNM